jgi:hypothetical protein
LAAWWKLGQNTGVVVSVGWYTDADQKSVKAVVFGGK